MLPLAALLAVVLAASPALTVLSVVVGATAAIVQGLGPGALAVRRPGAGATLRGGARRSRRVTRRARRSRSCSPRSTGCSGSASASTSDTCSRGCGRCWCRPRSCRRRVLPSWLGVVGVPIGIALLDRDPRVRRTQRARRLAPRRHDRPDRLHRLVAVADRDRGLAARLRELAKTSGTGRRRTPRQDSHDADAEEDRDQPGVRGDRRSRQRRRRGRLPRGSRPGSGLRSTPDCGRGDGRKRAR